jgi:DNA-binding winged helix-turn-helix (wHTH) protein
VQFSFADHLLDVERRELRRGGGVVTMEPQVFDLLVFLIENRARVVSKDDLIATVWGGRIVSESTLTSRITAVRKALGDSGEEQRLVRTFARKGIRFVGDVTTDAGGAAPAGNEAERPPLALPDRPAIAVLPFTNMSTTRSATIFPTASARTSSPRCRSCAGSS